LKETWIRIVIYSNGDAEDHESSAAYMTYTAQNVIRVLRSCAGYKNGYWADDPETGKMAAITFWDSRQAIEDANPALARFHDERERLGIKVESATNFKILSVSAGVTGWLQEAKNSLAR